MKKFILLCTLVFSLSAHSQIYQFDYVAEYEYTLENEAPTHDYKFINSKDNSFCLIVWEKGEEIKMRLVLEDGKFYAGKISKKDFFVETIALKCPYIGKSKNKINYTDVEFIKQKDTIIDAKKFSHFVINPLNKKKYKKYNYLPQHYIIDNEFNFNFPMFNPDELIYKLWKKGVEVPNGMVKEYYAIAPEGKFKFAERLKFIAIKKTILIDNNCD